MFSLVVSVRLFSVYEWHVGSYGFSGLRKQWNSLWYARSRLCRWYSTPSGPTT